MKQSVILSKPERENAGAMASNRFSYQVNWGVSKLIELHQNKEKYFLLMEQHEDALICDNLITPNKIELYQIKTKRGKNWKLKALTSLDSSKSIVGKLYGARNNFVPIEVTLTFITDAYFDLKDNKGAYQIKDSFNHGDLIKTDKLRFKQSIESCLSVNPIDDLNSLFFFEKISMNSDGHEIYAQGLLSKYFSVVLDKPFKKSSYYFIAGEVRKRNNLEKTVRTANSLGKLKSISRADFDKWIIYCVDNTRLGDRTMDRLKQELISEGLSFGVRRKNEKNASEYSLRIKGGDSSLQKFSKIIVSAEPKCSGATILLHAESIFNHIQHEIQFLDYYPKEFITSSILYELCR